MKAQYPKAFKILKSAFPESHMGIGDDFIKMILQRLKSIAREFRSEPMTLCHGDIKLDNLMFTDDAENGKDVIALDWGICGWGNPMADICYFLGRSIECTERKRWHEDLMNLYIEELHRVNPDLIEKYVGGSASEAVRMKNTRSETTIINASFASLLAVSLSMLFSLM